MTRRYNIRLCLSFALTALLLASCSMTKNIPADDQLFTGLKHIHYADERRDSFASHLDTTKEEVEAALATAPNGSLFGSSYYHTPWSWGLWVHNKYSGSKTAFGKWMTKSFGKAPVLMSQVNPALRASVAKSVLRNNGYLRGDVTYNVIEQKNPRKAKIAYDIHLDSLFCIDSLAYLDFPEAAQAQIDSTRGDALMHRGDPFSVSTLDAERTRISSLLRNNGYYYYNSGYASYLADTFAMPSRVQLQIKMATDLPPEALRPWPVSKIEVQFRKKIMEQLSDSAVRRHLTLRYNGNKSPIRPGIVLRNLKLRPRQLYSYEKHQESMSLLNATGVFSSVDFRFTPRNDSLDLTLNCIFDKPYDFYVETSIINRTIGRFGPELKIGFTRLNTFHGAEKLDINLHGAYEWQKSGGASANSYQYGADVSVEFPRIIAPFYNSDRIRRGKDGRPRRRRFYSTPTTLAKVSSDIIRRPGYYKMHIVSGEWTYKWQSSQTSRHEFSPITLKYQFLNSHTWKFDSILIVNPYLTATMSDYFIPKMRYTYTYTSPSATVNPIRWETTIEEAGNVTALYDVMRGHKWNEKEKTLFKNPYAQFIRIETDLTKTWTLGQKSRLVGHVNAGMIRSFGNAEADDAPFSEMFYAGGANSIRAFAVRSIGPGAFVGMSGSRQFNYIMQNGNLKMVANLEYRTQLFGKLQGALFLDAGNVWNWNDMKFEVSDDADDIDRLFANAINRMFKDTGLKASKLFDQIALGTGVGLRYDLEFLVVRVDWGVAIHMPYDTGRSGYFNVKRFRDAHTLHLAIGYPF